jgi:hypothetical protein
MLDGIVLKTAEKRTLPETPGIFVELGKAYLQRRKHLCFAGSRRSLDKSQIRSVQRHT